MDGWKKETSTHCMFYTSVPRVPPLRSRRMIGGVLAPHVPWQAMVYLSDKFLEGSYAGGALISERWILTSGRNLFAEKRRHEINGTSPLIPKVYLGITSRQEANESTEVAVDKVRQNEYILKIKYMFV